ncbi:ferritin-like domain-containing protein [Sphingomonas sp. MMS24-JH45]
MVTGSGAGAARADELRRYQSCANMPAIAADEVYHIPTTCATSSGHPAPAQPAIDTAGQRQRRRRRRGPVPGAFTAAARAAGVVGPNEIFDPFANDENFLIGAYLLTDVGVTAYRGSARLIANKTFLEAS